MQITSKNELRDEISNFQDARFISLSKATWMLFSFGIVYRNSPAVRLEVLLQDYHTVHYAHGWDQ